MACAADAGGPPASSSPSLLRRLSWSGHGLCVRDAQQYQQVCRHLQRLATAEHGARVKGLRERVFDGLVYEVQRDAIVNENTGALVLPFPAIRYVVICAALAARVRAHRTGVPIAATARGLATSAVAAAPAPPSRRRALLPSSAAAPPPSGSPPRPGPPAALCGGRRGACKRLTALCGCWRWRWRGLAASAVAAALAPPSPRRALLPSSAAAPPPSPPRPRPPAALCGGRPRTCGFIASPCTRMNSSR